MSFCYCPKVQNGQQVCLLLKKEDLIGGSKGTITLVLDVIYNKVRIRPSILKAPDKIKYNLN